MIFHKKFKFKFEPDNKTNYSSQKNNPFRGWYSIFPFRLPDTLNYKELSYCLQPDESLVLIKICIDNYADRPLDDTACDQIKRILDFFVQNNRTMIVRIAYDESGNGLTKEPTSIDTIKQHMKQIGPILAQYHNYILTTQGLFIGSWGEMHTSRYVGQKELAELALCFYNSCNGSLLLSVRKPSQLRMILYELKTFHKKYGISEKKAHIIAQSIGLYNDALLASDTDYGTYADLPIFESQFTKSWGTDKELEFQQELCVRVPNGGEVVNLSPRNDAAAAIERFKQIHVTYLNSQYDASVLDKWKNEYISYDCEKQSVYNYIGSRLGYCIFVKSAFSDRKNNNLIHIILKNDGFAPIYRNVRLKLTLTDGITFSYIYSMPQMLFYSGCEADMVCELQQLLPGVYKITACLEDIGTEKEIHFYNTASIGTLTVVK
jgi:hypothetical protein